MGLLYLLANPSNTVDQVWPDHEVPAVPGGDQLIIIVEEFSRGVWITTFPVAAQQTGDFAIAYDSVLKCFFDQGFLLSIFLFYHF